MNDADSAFSYSRAQHIVKDLMRPNPWIYWLDFLITIAIGHTSYAMTRLAWEFLAEPLWLRWLTIAGCHLLCVLAFYRAVMFIHELVHLPRDGFKAFRFTWNLLCGIPFLTPSFLYYTHIDHHRRAYYGTEHDGEYLPLRTSGRRLILLYLLQVPIVPILGVIRWFVIPPLCWVIPGFRAFVHQHMSSMVIDPKYVRPLPSAKTRRMIYLQETLCFLWCLACLVVPLVFLDRWPIPFLVQGYATGLGVLTLNHVRTMGAHLWTNGDRHEMTFLGQVLDSVNVSAHPWLSELWGPVGTRYHALHHLFAAMPYHSLPEAHRRLMAELPADSPYRQTVRPSLLSVVIELWRQQPVHLEFAAAQAAAAEPAEQEGGSRRHTA